MGPSNLPPRQQFTSCWKMLTMRFRCSPNVNRKRCWKASRSGRRSLKWMPSTRTAHSPTIRYASSSGMTGSFALTGQWIIPGLLLHRRFTTERGQGVLRNQFTKRRNFHQNRIRSRKARRLCIGSRSPWWCTIRPPQQQRSTEFRWVI